MIDVARAWSEAGGRMKKALASLFVILGAMLAVTETQAQQLMVPIWSPKDVMLDNTRQPSLGETGANNRDSRPSQASRRTLSSARYDTSYRPSQRRTKANQSAMINRARANDEGGGDQFERLFGKDDSFGSVKGTMTTYGLNSNDVSHAYALYWTELWVVANKSYEAPSREALLAVGRQSAEVFATNDAFGALTNTQKQRSAEEFMALAMILEFGWLEVRGSPKLEARFVDKAIKGGQAVGLDLTAMTLTNSGFVLRR
jgi:hypothetical protein